MDIPIILINSFHNTDQLSLIQKYCPKDFSLSYSIDTRFLHSLTNNELKLLHALPNNTFYSFIGHTLSHYRIWNNISQPTLIIEDNISFSPNFKVILNNITLPNQCDILFIGGQSTPNFFIDSHAPWSSQKLTRDNFYTFYQDTDTTHIFKRKIITEDNLLSSHTWLTPISRHTSSYIITPKGVQKLLKIIYHNQKDFISSPLNSSICSMGRNGLLDIYELFPHITYNISPVSIHKHYQFNTNLLKYLSISINVVDNPIYNHLIESFINGHKLKICMNEYPDIYIFIYDRNSGKSPEHLLEQYNPQQIIYISNKYLQNDSKDLFIKYCDDFDFELDRLYITESILKIVYEVKNHYYKCRLESLLDEP